MKIARLGIVLLLSAGLAACASDYGPKQTGGTLVGAAAGGLAGAQIGKGRGRLVATGVGTLLGALVGSEVGKSLDRADQLYAERANYDALENNRSGQRSSWRNPDSGNYGYIEPTQTYQDADGQYCREYTQTIYVGGRPQTAYGTACREPDGSWRTANN